MREAALVVRCNPLLGALVLVRLSYVLNAGDLLLTYAVLAALEARGCSGGLRRVLCIGAAAFAGLAAYAYYSLHPISFRGGGIASYDWPEALASVALFSSVPIVALVSSGRSWTSTRVGRMQIVSGTFCLLGFAVPALLVLTTGSPERYYFYKYPFAATVIAPCVALPWVVLSLSRWGRRTMPAVRSAAVPLVAGLALVGWFLGHDAYAQNYRQIMLRPPEVHDPHADPRIVEHIRGTLDRAAALFGGYYTLRWPEESFTNAMLGHSYFEIDRTYSEPRTGHCVFWDRSPHAFSGHANKDTAKALTRLEENGESTCTMFVGRVEGEASRRVCHRCNADRREP